MFSSFNDYLDLSHLSSINLLSQVYWDVFPPFHFVCLLLLTTFYF